MKSGALPAWSGSMAGFDCRRLGRAWGQNGESFRAFKVSKNRWVKVRSKFQAGASAAGPSPTFVGQARVAANLYDPFGAKGELHQRAIGQSQVPSKYPFTHFE